MEKKIGLSLLLFLVFTVGYSQNKHKKGEEKKTYISAYLGYKFKLLEERTAFSTQYQETETIKTHGDIINFGIGLERRLSKGWYYELVLTKLSISKDDDVVYNTIFGIEQTVAVRGENQLTTELGSRFEYGKYLWQSKKERVELGVGIGTELFFFKRRISPNTSAYFPIKESRLGVMFQFIPRITTRLSDKVNLELKIVPDLYRLHRDVFRVENPILSEKQKKQKSLESEGGLDSFGLNIGVKYRIK